MLTWWSLLAPPQTQVAARRIVITLLALAVLAVAGGLIAGWHGAASVFLGGLVAAAGAAAYVLTVIASLGGRGGGTLRPLSAGQFVRAILRAFAVKLLVIVVLLWLCFTQYAKLVAPIFLGTFTLYVLLLLRLTLVFLDPLTQRLQQEG